MSGEIIHLPRTPAGRVALVVEKVKGEPLSGIDWDMRGNAEFSDYCLKASQKQAEIINFMNIRGSSTRG